ncbi:MAG: site-specific DNA-methyltransferase [Phaeodactylibacter sp.]|nr:site-specific DNA-methyltransferase [Phaeodactylibacter sp.]
MKPAFTTDENRVQIYQEDVLVFLQALPDESVDVIVTDPAYSGMNQKLQLGSGKIIGVYKEKGRETARWFEEFHDTLENYQAFLTECKRVLRKDRHLYLMFDSFSLLSLAPIVREIFEVKNILCWDKVNIGMGHYFRRRHEFILFASKGKRKLNSKSIPDIWPVKRVSRAAYPTQKPTEVFRLMLHASAAPGFVVCDPFVGSGSSAIAALQEDCQFIGCDIADKSIELTGQRIRTFLETGKDPLQPKSLLADEYLANIVLKNASKL